MDGRSMNKVPPKNRDIAMVFQNYALYPNMKVKDNIAFPLKMRHCGKKEIKSRVAEVAQKLELDTLLERKPGALSGGQRQRVALARSMVRKPKLFLMDEPLANLDARLRTEMRREIITLQRELGVTTIYVTHDQTEAMTMGTCIAVINEGVLQQLGKPQEVYGCPANLFVAGFIGSPHMNLWDTGLVTEQDCCCLTLGESRISVDKEKLPPEPWQGGNNGRHSSGAYQTCRPGGTWRNTDGNQYCRKYRAGDSSFSKSFRDAGSYYDNRR